MEIPADVPNHFQEQNIYFYFGWQAHKDGAPYINNTVADWRWGWMEREKMVREAIYEAIAEAD